jgi:assimilatory nitrate reductase catalytic subunit
MGSRLFSNTTNLFGGRDFLSVPHRAKVAEILGIDIERIPDRDSWAYDQIVDAIADGKIKGLWIIATNSSHSWINQRKFNEVTRRLDFLVVQDMYHTTETAQRAHLVLPAAAWGEKTGTFINSERRIGLVKKVSRPPGQALSDFNIFRLVAQYWGCGEMFKGWSSPEAVFHILRELSRGQPCDFTGIRDYQMLDQARGIQWPFPESRAPGSLSENRSVAEETARFAQERRLFEDGIFHHDDGKARFLFEAPRELPEPLDSEYPFTLLTGRGTSAQWHTQTRTEKSGVLRRLYPEQTYVELNPLDAERLGICANETVQIASRRSQVTATAFITNTVQAGQVFIPMHYARANQLTCSSFDPYSRQPAYKACAVSVRPLRKRNRGTCTD